MKSDKKIDFLQDKIQSMLFDIHNTRPAYAPLVPADINLYQRNITQNQASSAAPTAQIPENQPLYRKSSRRNTLKKQGA